MMEVSTSSVSVVMCTYRGAAHLEAQLESLLHQTVLPLELIVNDDLSDDETVPLLERFLSTAPFPVKVTVNEKNVGSTRNFDQALSMARGKFLALCDQDDLWFPDKLATLIKVLEENPDAGGVFSDAQLIQGQTRRQLKKSLWALHGFTSRKQYQFANGGAIDLLLKHDVVTGATLMVRATLRDVWSPIPASWVHDGWITWMLAVHSRLIPVALPLIGYRIHAQQQLGVNQTTRRQQMKQLHTTERARYARVAGQFTDLLLSLKKTHSGKTVLLKSIDQKIAFLQRRAGLSRSFPKRFLQMMFDLPSYFKYARGWRSLRKDLMLF